MNEGEITAILDWDNAIVGDPLYDFARSKQCFEEPFEDINKEKIGNAFTQGYRKNSDKDINEDLIEVYEIAASINKSSGILWLSKHHENTYKNKVTQCDKMLEESSKLMEIRYSERKDGNRNPKIT